MSSSAGQGLQSYPEPWIIEPRVLRQKLAQRKSKFSQSSVISPQHVDEEKTHNAEHNTNKNDKDNEKLGGWSFIQAVTDISHNCKKPTETEKVYVHPLVKCSSSTLSTKSLEMCTESLGSETGSEVSENSEEFSSISLEKQSFHGMRRSKSREFGKKMNRSCSFPPPLTSITSSESVQVRPHRENGRLVIKAVTVSSSSTYFQAERVDGRLKLSLLKNASVDEKEGEEVSEHENADEDEVEEEDYDEDENDVCWGEDMEGDSENVGCEIGIGELPRPSRCKEGGSRNKEMPNWGSFWVAIS